MNIYKEWKRYRETEKMCKQLIKCKKIRKKLEYKVQNNDKNFRKVFKEYENYIERYHG